MLAIVLAHRQRIDEEAAMREPLEELARSAVRQKPSKDNLFAAVVYDRGAWDRVVKGIDPWLRRPHAGPPRDPSR